MPKTRVRGTKGGCENAVATNPGRRGRKRVF